MNSLDFSQEAVERASDYHRPLYLATAASVALSAATYAVLAWPARGAFDAVSGFGWAGAAAAWAGIVVVASTLVHLPLGYWRGLARERRWGFSTQTLRGWLVDQAKGAAVSIVLAAAAWTGVVALARALPGWWVAPAAAAAALAVLFLAFVAPVVLEPLFNRFRPLEDLELAARLRTIAEDATVPVREVLVTDLSRRTTKVNAYVSGLGATRRVVLGDTLLAAADPGQIAVIVAHELGHRRERHVAKLTLVAMLGAAAAAVVVWAALGTAVASPRELPVVLLILLGLELAMLAPGAALSRRWERVADRISIELTHDLPAYERAHIELAQRNLSDIAPPRLAYVLLFSHPTPMERLAYGRNLV